MTIFFCCHSLVLLIFFVAKTAFHQVSSRRREKPKATDTTFVCSKPSLRLSPGNVFIMAVFFTTGCFSMFLPIFISKIKNLSSKRLTPVGWRSLEKVALVGYNSLLILLLCGGRVWKPTLYEAFLIIEFVMVQGCMFRLTCSYPELTEDHVFTSAYVKIFRTVTRNAVNKSVWRKKNCSWPPLNKYAVNIWLSSLRIRAHLSWRTGKHLHVLHVLRTYPTCSCPGQQDTTTYAALRESQSILINDHLIWNWLRQTESILNFSISHPMKFMLIRPPIASMTAAPVATTCNTWKHVHKHQRCS